MEVFLNYLSASGTIATAASVVSAFILYKKEINNANTNKVRFSLQVLYNNIIELDKILNLELANEMASAVVYSNNSQYSIKEIYNICNEAIEKKLNKENTIKNIKSTLGVFVVPFQNTLSEKYNSLLSQILIESINFNPYYPGLYRFSKAATLWMNNVFTSYKRLLIDEDFLSKFIYDEMIKKSKKYKSFECFQKELLDNLLSLIETFRGEKWQKDIDSLKTLIEMVYSAHIGLTNSAWNKLKRTNKKIKMIPYSEVDTITGDLRESEKYFRTVMNHDKCIKYIALVQAMETHND